ERQAREPDEGPDFAELVRDHDTMDLGRQLIGVARQATGEEVLVVGCRLISVLLGLGEEAAVLGRAWGLVVGLALAASIADDRGEDLLVGPGRESLAPFGALGEPHVGWLFD